MAFGACNYGITNAGKGVLGALWEGLTLAVAGFNTYQAVDFAQRQYKLAKMYLDISHWWDNYHKSAFQPVEGQEFSEAMALKEVSPLYDVQRGRAQTAGRIKFKGAADKAVQCTSEYCTGLRARLLRDFTEQEASAVAALTGLGYRNERAYAESRSDVRWKRMINTAARGRGLPAEAVSSAQLAFGIYGDLGQQAANAAAGAAASFGYLRNRRDTYIPQQVRAQPVQPQPDPQASAQPAAPTYTSGYYSNQVTTPVPNNVQYTQGGN